MAFDFSTKKDFWAGVMLIVVGIAALIVARDYEFGTALRMGPGFFPKVLSWTLILFGLYIGISGFVKGERISGSWSLRALIILPVSLLLFGELIDPPMLPLLHVHMPGGFVPAMLVLVFGSATATTEFRLIEVLAFSVFLTALCTGVFIYFLGLPYPLISGFE